MRAKVLQDIQTDFNDLALEARHSRNAGISGQLSGLFASGQHKDVKAAAEAAQVALRALEASADPAEACRGCTVRVMRSTCFRRRHYQHDTVCRARSEADIKDVASECCSSFAA